MAWTAGTYTITIASEQNEHPGERRGDGMICASGTAYDTDWYDSTYPEGSGSATTQIGAQAAYMAWVADT